MAKVFEDEFTEIQSGMVSLAIEALETADMTVDKIYIYAFGTEHEGFFNLFFVKDGKLLHNHQVGVSEEIIDQPVPEEDKPAGDIPGEITSDEAASSESIQTVVEPEKKEEPQDEEEAHEKDVPEEEETPAVSPAPAVISDPTDDAEEPSS